MTGTASRAASTRPSAVPVSPGVTGSTEECARAEARQLWADLAHARSFGALGTTAPAEDAVFRFYLPLAHALGDGAVGRAITTEAARSAAELGLAQAVLSWPGSDDGFLRFASRSITTVLRHLVTTPAGRHSPLVPLVFPPLPGSGPEPVPGSHTTGATTGASS